MLCVHQLRVDQRLLVTLDPDLVGRLDQRVRDEQVSQKLPTLVVGLARDGVPVWWAAAGTTGAPGGTTPDADTQYRIGSISKTFVAVMVMRLRDEGALDLNDRIGAHLPELAALPITIAQLLSHTSGLRAETPAPWWERVPGAGFEELTSSSLRAEDLRWRPGRRFHYSNVGYAVLGELVARRRGAPLEVVLRQELLGPLGLTRTTERPVAPHVEGYAVHPHADLVHAEPAYHAGAMAPAGQLWSTIGDLARWSAVLAGSRPDALRPESASEMAEPLALSDVPAQPWTGAYGLGLQVQNRDGQRRVGHAGAMPGHWAMVVIDQGTKDALVAVANSTYRGNRTELYDDVFAMLASTESSAKTPFVPRAPTDPLAMEVLGTWYWGPVEYRMHLSAAGCLELRGVAPGRDCDFAPVADGTYVGQFGYFSGETLRVVREPGGGPVSHLDVASFVFTRAPYDASSHAIPGGLDPRGWHAPGDAAPGERRGAGGATRG